MNHLVGVTSKVLMVALIVATTGLVSGAAAAEIIDAPTRDWTLHRTRMGCIASRRVAFGRDEGWIALRASPPSAHVEFVIGAPSGFVLRPGLAVRIAAMNGRHWDGTVKAAQDANGTTVYGVLLDRAALDPLLLSNRIALRGGSGRSMVATTGSAAIETDMMQCQADLLAGWRIDPTEAAAPPQEARRDATSGLVADDYPPAASRYAEEGDVTVAFRIEPTGTIGDCRVIGPSGATELDDGSCPAVSRHIRYQPALNAAGQAVASWDRITLHWRIPHQPG